MSKKKEEGKNLNNIFKSYEDYSFRNDDINDENENPNKTLISNSPSKKKKSNKKRSKKVTKKSEHKKI